MHKYWNQDSAQSSIPTWHSWKKSHNLFARSESIWIFTIHLRTRNNKYFANALLLYFSLSLAFYSILCTSSLTASFLVTFRNVRATSMSCKNTRIRDALCPGTCNHETQIINCEYAPWENEATWSSRAHDIVFPRRSQWGAQLVNRPVSMNTIFACSVSVFMFQRSAIENTTKVACGRVAAIYFCQRVPKSFLFFSGSLVLQTVLTTPQQRVQSHSTELCLHAPCVASLIWGKINFSKI